jgi:transcriptional regulator with XRE-family HTH domain
MSTDLNTRLSAALLQYMEEHDVNQVQVARVLNRSNAYVWGRLTGRHALSVDIIGAVAQLVHVPADRLTGELALRAASLAPSQPESDTPRE